MSSAGRMSERIPRYARLARLPSLSAAAKNRYALGGGGHRGDRWRASEAHRARYHRTRRLPADAPPALRGRVGRASQHALEHVFRGRIREQSRERIDMPSRIPQYIERQAFDLIVVGAGINGAGIARDAAMRGLRVLLLD